MNIRKRISIFWGLIFFIPFSLFSHEIEFNNSNQSLRISKFLEVFEDKNSFFSIQQVSKLDSFKTYKQEVPNLGVSSSTYWIKVKIKNTTEIENLLLEVQYPILDRVDFYAINPNGLIDSISTGEYKPFSQRKYNDPNFIFDLNIPKNQVREYFIRIKSGEQILVPIVIGKQASIFEALLNKDILFGIYVGIMVVMLFYNLFIYFTVKDKLYLYYVVYLIMVGLTQTHLLGYTFKYLWPNSPWLAIHSMFLTPSLVGIAIAEFIKVFLRTKENVPKLHIGLNIINFVYFICIALGVTGFHNESQKIIHINAMLISLYGLFIAIKVSTMGHRSARFFLIAWSVFLVGVCVFILKDFGVLPYNAITNYMMPSGSAVEVVLLSFALADRINILKKEKEESQLDALRALEENRKLITDQNILLEQKVHERTLALEEINKELNTTLSDLKEAQTQLVDAEKMASLGQLTAGIAHEINNPINFVSSNVKPLKMDISDLLEVIGKYESITNKEQFESKVQDIESFKKKIDLEYIKNEIDILLNGIEDGAKRTAEIVSGLKNFSRLDEGDVKLANLNDGIRSTLVLLRNSIPENIEVELSLGEIPSIECYPGKLNQVFMNIFNNSIDAMKSRKIDALQKLSISTFENTDGVTVSIEDTGIGMKPEVKAKIFEPFFTTKDVGSGTGLGMSIVFKIIETHRGKIEIDTEFGKGTKINLHLRNKIDLLT